eukprot:scaffold391168_cov42-Prasinocladus_malaysianus.AAC.1
MINSNVRKRPQGCMWTTASKAVTRPSHAGSKTSARWMSSHRIGKDSPNLRTPSGQRPSSAREKCCLYPASSGTTSPRLAQPSQ